MNCTTHYYACKCREAKFKRLYIAVNEMMVPLGMNGEIDTRDKRVDAVMDVLHDMDGGVFDAEKVFDNFGKP